MADMGMGAMAMKGMKKSDMAGMQGMPGMDMAQMNLKGTQNGSMPSMQMDAPARSVNSGMPSMEMPRAVRISDAEQIGIKPFPQPGPHTAYHPACR